MNLRDGPEEAAFRGRLRAWIAASLPSGLAGSAARTGHELHREWSRKLSRAGYAGLTWPREHGGGGLGPEYQAIFLEELARAGAPQHMGVIGLHMAGPTLIALGTMEQKRRHLRPILEAEEIWCQGFSEPGAGSDLAAVTTRAEPRGDRFLVNGQKVWSSYAHVAGWCILLARSDPGAPRHQGLTYLLVDMSSPGIEVRPLRQMTGDADFNEIFLTDVEVPVANVVGEAGQGWSVAMTTLLHERGTLGFAATGGLEAAVRRLLELARERPLDGRLRDLVAREWVSLQALKLTNHRALTRLRKTGVPGAEGSIIKLAWSEANQRVTRLAAEILGEDALVAGDWVHAQLRSRGNTIEAGTSEILRNIVAERVLGLPRSR
ncbi:MAG: acyl-CoA dehydrogenase family protein [Candidatus Dormibacteraceae bacterium]